MAPLTSPPTRRSSSRPAWLLLLSLPALSAGFHGPTHRRLTKATQTRSVRRVGGPSLHESSSLPSPSGLLRSDIPRSPRDQNNRGPNPPETRDEDDVFFRFELPPPPEDQLVLVGDLVSIFVYCFSDHWICHDLAMAQSRITAASDPLQDLPVWLDGSHAFAPTVLGALQDARTVTQYSPLLAHAGLAACVLSLGWLLGGWLQGAFLMRNTLDCRTSHALGVTARAWLVSCAFCLWAVATASLLPDLLGDLLLPGAPHLPWIGFSRGDADLILDSLVVLALWRALISSLLGSNSGGDGDGRRK